jgi:phosphatidylglycerophosphatase C
MSGTTVAAFDFDGTLTTRDSVVPFLRRFTSRRVIAARLVPHLRRVLVMVVRRDRDQLRLLATRIAFAGRPVTEIETEGAAFGLMLERDGLRDDTTARLRWHLAEGHRVVIVSASYQDYVEVVASGLGDVAVLATRLEVVDGFCTGGLDGPNCRGREKVERLTAWMAAQGLDRADLTVYAYGDSAGDDEMLAWADHPHRVNGPLASVAPTV